MNHPPASIDKIQKEISILQEKLTKSSLYEETEIRSKLQYLEELLNRKQSNNNV